MLSSAKYISELREKTIYLGHRWKAKTKSEMSKIKLCFCKCLVKNIRPFCVEGGI